MKANKTIADLVPAWIAGPVEVEVGRLHNVIVTELRPMDDAPKDGSVILVFNSTFNDFEAVYYSDSTRFFMRDPSDSPAQSKLIGWIPMPRYIPNKKYDKELCDGKQN